MPTKFSILMYSLFINTRNWFKVRDGVPSVRKVIKAVSNRNKSVNLIASKNDNIIVVGIGTSTLAFLNVIKKMKFENVKILSKDTSFGGKCVNYGCMPSAYSLTLGGIEPSLRREMIFQFVESLKSDVQTQFQKLDWPRITGEVSHITGKFIHLKTGEQIKFDRTVLGLGSTYPAPKRIPLNTTKVIQIEDLWSLDAGANLIIYSKDNVASVSIAEVANSLGLRTTLLLAGHNPLKDLPSFKYFVRILKKKGINIFDNTRLIRVDEDGVSYERGSLIDTLPYDAFLVTSKPLPTLPMVDDRSIEMQDLDLETGSLPSRPDISFMGDCSGYYSASEAEFQSRMLAINWICGTKIDLKALAEMPIFLHAENTLAITGKFETLFKDAGKWNEMDFKALGWSKVSKLDGKIWYLMNEKENKVDAIHICHPMAAELIAIAKNLIHLPLSDAAWNSSFIHPSASEIFKLISNEHCYD